MQHLHFVIIATALAGCDLPEQSTTPTKVDESASARSIVVIGWNVESDGNDPKVIAAQLKEFSKADIFCLSEVHPKSLQTYLDALPNYESISSQTGGGDRLQILFDAKRFKLLEKKELHTYGDYKLNDGNHRSPLYARLKDSVAGCELIVMTNHLARGKAEMRNQQAIGLREWARDQNVPVVNVGDFNMDYHYEKQKGNDAFGEMLQDNIWQWVRPSAQVDSNWADRDEDGKDDYPGSILDFAFIAGAAKTWSPECRVLVREGDFPDDDQTSDHRPVELRLSP